MKDKSFAITIVWIVGVLLIISFVVIVYARTLGYDTSNMSIDFFSFFQALENINPDEDSLLNLYNAIEALVEDVNNMTTTSITDISSFFLVVSSFFQIFFDIIIIIADDLLYIGATIINILTWFFGLF